MSPLEFIYVFRPRFSDTDAYGIVHHSKYYCYFEEARLALEKHLDLKRRLPPDTDVRFPVIASSCEYRHPLVYDGTEYTVSLKCRVLGDCKIEFDYFLTKGDLIYAKGRTSHAVTANGELCIGEPWFIALKENVLGKERS